MTFKEYTEALRAARKEYADSIREMARTNGDDFDLIMLAQHEASEYHFRVEALIAEYRL